MHLTVIAFRSLILTQRQQRTNTLLFNMIGKSWLLYRFKAPSDYSL